MFLIFYILEYDFKHHIQNLIKVGLMRRIIYFPSEEYGSNHTSVEALFNKYLRKYFHIQVVYSGNNTKKIENDNIVINRDKKSDFFNQITKYIQGEMDIVIVRNDFKVLKNVIFYKKKYHLEFKVGFQCTFLHSYRRIVQAHIEKKKVLRKYIQYLITSRNEDKLLREVDFLIPNSKMMNKVVNKFNKPYTFIYSSIDLDLLPKIVQKKSTEGIIKFVYIGTVDKLREVDLIFKAFGNLKNKNWILDVYTKQSKLANEYKMTMIDNQENVNIYSAIKRESLYNKIALYDVGIALIPVNDLYNVSSPIKLSEYFGCKLTVMTTAIPEAVDLYADTNSAFFTNFDLESIEEKLNTILETTKEKLHLMGENGFNIVKKQRNYKNNALYIKSFLESLYD